MNMDNMVFEQPLESDRDQETFITNKIKSRDVSMVAENQNEDDEEEGY